MKLLKPLLASSLLLSSLHALSYETAPTNVSTPKDSKALLDFKFDFDLSSLEGNSESFDKSELSLAANAEIYNAKDIKASQAQDLYDFLAENTSVNITPSYGSHATQLIDLGGYGQANGYQNVVIKINGRRINNIDGIPQLLSSISLDTIASIKILKGAGSVLNGDGATGGVISITLKKSSEIGYKVYGGSFGTRYGQLRAGYSSKKFFISAMRDEFTSDGSRVYNATTGENNGEFISNASLSLSYKPFEAAEFLFNYNKSNLDIKYSGALSQAEYDSDPSQATTAGFTSHQQYSTDAYGTGFNIHINKFLSLHATASLEDKNVTYVGSSQYITQYIPFDFYLKFASKKFEFKAGIDGFNGKRSVANSNETSKNNIAAFASYNFTYDTNHGYNIGYRLEKVAYEYAPVASATLSQDNNLHAFEAGYAYKISKNETAFMNYSNAFLAPNIDAFFAYNGFGNPYIFNAFINPQHSQTTTIGYKSIHKSHTFKASLFFASLQDEIYYNASTFVNTNLDKTRKIGLNIYDKFQWTSTLSSRFNYDYIDPTIVTDDTAAFNGNTLPGVSNHNLSLSATIKLTPKMKFRIAQQYRSESYAQNDFANSATQKQEAYTSTDVSFHYAYHKSAKLFVKVQNLFDQANGIWIRDDNIYPVNFTRNIQVGIQGSY